ncbi:MAG TPA: hypothetical protein VFH88_05125 [Candidatus Krumholzibacteria bacterium]|nr:hypothetical protein [Candidatus Krumholzibacteria bacterium]
MSSSLHAAAADSLTAVPAFSDSLGVVPAAARAFVDSILDPFWKKPVSDSPTFFGLPPDVDVSHVTLGDPFILFQFSGRAAREYKESSIDDPRGFANMVKYCFPVLFPDGTSAGSIIVLRNRDEHGVKLHSNADEYTTAGLFRPNDVLPTRIADLRRDYTGVYALQFMDRDIKRFVVWDQTYGWISGMDRESFKPLRLDAAIIKPLLPDHE